MTAQHIRISFTLPGACAALLVSCLVWSLACGADEPAAARVTELEGRVMVMHGGSARRVVQGEELIPGDTVWTLRDASVLLVFRDESKYELGANTRFQIEQFKYGTGGDAEMAVTRIVTGLFRYVSGLIGHNRPRSVSIHTAAATIGIRGTHIIGEVTETSARIGLLDPEEGDAPSAIEVSNVFGTVTVDKSGYVTEIPDLNSPPSVPRPMDLGNMTRSLRAVQSMRRIIAPRAPRVR